MLTHALVVCVRLVEAIDCLLPRSPTFGFGTGHDDLTKTCKRAKEALVQRHSRNHSSMQRHVNSHRGTGGRPKSCVVPSPKHWRSNAGHRVESALVIQEAVRVTVWLGATEKLSVRKS